MKKSSKKIVVMILSIVLIVGVFSPVIAVADDGGDEGGNYVAFIFQPFYPLQYGEMGKGVEPGTIMNTAMTEYPTHPNGLQFVSWTSMPEGVVFADETSWQTTFTVPTFDFLIKGIFASDDTGGDTGGADSGGNYVAFTFQPFYPLEWGAHGDGVAPGSPMNIDMPPHPHGLQFVHWTSMPEGVVFADETSMQTTFTVPIFDFLIKGVFISEDTGGDTGGTSDGSDYVAFTFQPFYPLQYGEMGKGVASGTILNTVWTEYPTHPQGLQFVRWTSMPEGVVFADETSWQTTFTVPDFDFLIKGVFTYADISGYIPDDKIMVALEQDRPFISIEYGQSTVISEYALHAIRDSGKVLEIELPNGIIISIDSDLITDSARSIDINIDFTITQPATNVNGVQFPANTIVLSPVASGEFGFTISFNISAEKLAEAGLNGNNVRLFHISTGGVVTEHNRLRRNDDGSVTISISSASRYVLSEVAPEGFASTSPPTSGLPETGIENNRTLWSTLLALAIMCIIGTVIMLSKVNVKKNGKRLNIK